MDKRYGSRQKGIFIHDIALSNSLKKCGMVPAKTLILEFPSNEILPENLLWHFIRGYFDGDGSVSISRKYSCISFCGSKPFIKTLSDILKIYNISSRINDCGNYDALAVNSIESRNLFMCYLYKDATIYLNRKYQKWQEFLKLTE